MKYYECSKKANKKNTLRKMSALEWQWSLTSVVLAATPGVINLIVAPAFLWSMNRPYRGWQVQCDDPEVNKKTCKFKNPALPPAAFFSIIRLILLTAIGFAWGWSRELTHPQSNSCIPDIDIGFAVLTGLIFLWSLIFATGAAMRFATMYLFILFLYSLALTTYLFSQLHLNSGYLMLPLLSWEIYSMYLNMSNVQFYLKAQKF